METADAGWANRRQVQSLLDAAIQRHEVRSCNGTWSELDEAIDEACVSEDPNAAAAEVWRIFDAGPPFPWGEATAPR